MIVRRKASEDAAPLAMAGVTRPRPVPKMIIVSPTFAGRVAIPGIEPAGAARLPSGLIAIAGPTPNCVLNIPGESPATVARNVADTAAFAVTMMSAGPNGTVQGTCRLICVEETNSKGAGTPPMVAETPPSESGNGIDEACTLAEASPVPKSEASPPGVNA